MKIKGHLDLFSGIGGFSLGLKNAGVETEWTGFSDIDKYANKLYKRRFPDAEQLGTITDVSYKSLRGRQIDLLTGGFPCQAFSIAGKRQGFKDTRGTLFFDIQRLLQDYINNKSPIPCILLENVKGLLNHDNNRTFATIFRVLSNLNYTIECQLVNTKWVLPQNRERIYIFGRYNGNPSGRKVFPVRANGKEMQKKLNQIGTIGNKNSEALRVYDTSCARTIKNGGGMGAKTGLYRVEDVNLIAKKRKHDTPKEINAYLKKHKNRTIKEIAKELELPKTQVEHYFREDVFRAIPSPDVWLQLKELLGFDDIYDKQVTEIYEKEYEFESSKRVYSDKGIAKTLDTGNAGLYKVKSAALRTWPRTGKDDKNRSKRLEVRKDNVANTITSHQLDSILKKENRIRRLTPIECERLQGFPDNWTDGQSDTQRYKQCGNAVTVPIVEMIMRKIYEQ
tara:strand:+ start:6 stop:1355 length:1350 start_codon:yes stop_codon:yes gene_type:complete